MTVVEVTIESIADALETAKSYDATMIGNIPVIQVRASDGTSFVIIQGSGTAIRITG